MSERPARATLVAVAAGRVAIGTALWVAPETATRALGFDRMPASAMAMARLAATRDLVIGVWQLRSAADPVALRGAALAGVLADAGDTVAFALAAIAGERRAGWRGLAAALPATALGLWAHWAAQTPANVTQTPVQGGLRDVRRGGG